ncbi:MFS transporter [Nitratiruptor tergarcus]|uniref:MFS transporter, PPP family, 3-phenylpropionic acid transporter n=1 Tax=Nitratiruptor tergarcus DSM 16512 TaxID=1069081 RepID=A0A1W1WSG6_9BACT|nr:MFS transporter [Nitratiruptor tergarcus]SMC08663.1 MFS transporter, PPP family, 3-phenylpropionic acid transporter [Nitratiruptor tergarcus DSM 16512]
MQIFSLTSAFYFFFFAIIGVYVIYLPKVLDILGYTSLQIGIIFAISPLTRFLTPFFFLKKWQLTPKIYKFALFLALIAGILFFFTIDNFYLFTIPNTLLGISFALTLPFVETIALAHIGKERYGKSRLFGSIGFIVIALVLAKFMESPKIALWFLFGAICFTALFGFALAKEDLTKSKEASQESFSLLAHWPLWVNIFLLQVSFGPFYNFFTIYEKEHGLDYTTISYLWTFGVIAEIFMLYFQGPLLKKNLLKLLQLCSFITAGRWLILHFFPTNLPLLYFAQSLHAFSFALYYTAAISHLFFLYKNKTLAQQFFGGVSFGLGGMVGSLLAGVVYGKYLFMYAAGVALLASLVLFLEYKKIS